MMKLLSLFGLAIGANAAALVGAQEAVPVKPTMAEVVAYALVRNPDLLAARLRVDSAFGERRIARAVPNPTFVTIPGIPFQYSLVEPLDIGPQRVYRTRAAGHAVVAARYDVEDATRQLLFSVRQSFLDLLLAEALRGIASEQRDIFLQLLRADSLRFNGGDLPARDVSTSELQFVRSDAALVRAEVGARAARLALQVLMGVRRPDTAFRVTGALSYRPLAVSLDTLRGTAFASRPDLAAARERQTQSRSLRALANSAIIPVPGVGVVYQPDPFASGSHYALAVSLSLPLLYWFGGERQRAAASVTAATIARQRAEAQAESDVAVAGDNFRAIRDLAQRYESGLLPKAAAFLETQRFAYQQGAASFLELLNAILTYGAIRTEYTTALHDYWVTAYALNRAVGRELVP
ncbi:MAG: TolC family protein [Gemmatimonadaceae bacterium]